jgi:hypothetical protein
LALILGAQVQLGHQKNYLSTRKIRKAIKQLNVDDKSNKEPGKGVIYSTIYPLISALFLRLFQVGAMLSVPIPKKWIYASAGEFGSPLAQF